MGCKADRNTLSEATTLMVEELKRPEFRASGPKEKDPAVLAGCLRSGKCARRAGRRSDRAGSSRRWSFREPRPDYLTHR